MVRKNTLKTKILSALLVFSVVLLPFLDGSVSATQCTPGNSPCSSEFQVDIPEVLTVQITQPSEWVVGDVGTFLRNTITLNVASNNPAGFTASMTSAAATADGSALTSTHTGSTSVIPMLTSSWTRSNTTATKFWGYSLDDSSETGTYNALALRNSVTPTTLISSGTTASASKDIYIGAKADSSIDSGAYQGTIIISVVTGTITPSNPVIPTDPATPEDTTSANPTYQAGVSQGDPGRTIYTNTTQNTVAGTTTSTLAVSEGDTRAAYQDPQGVSTAKVGESTPLATGIAVTAAIAAISGAAFFMFARNHGGGNMGDDDEF